MAETRRPTVPAAEEILGLYFPVLDHGFVALVDYLGGDHAVERAARGSYAIGEEERSEAERRNLIRYLISGGYACKTPHTSPFEMTEVVLHVGMPIFVMRQWVRHRMASMNEYSGRYSPMPLMFYNPSPDEVCYQAIDNKQGSGGPVQPADYAAFLGDLEDGRVRTSRNYRDALDAGIAREMARVDLPLSTYTYAYWKIDLHNALRMFGLRSDGHAQRQTRAYSDVLGGILDRVAPLSFQAFLDYQFNTRTFTRAEMAALRALGDRDEVHYEEWVEPPAATRSLINEVLYGHGVTRGKQGTESREVKAFWAKLVPAESRNFALDLGAARPASYFMDEVEKHVVERPAG